MRYSLRICAGKQAGREIPIRGPRFLVGSADNCHLKITTAQVSPYHCALLVQDDGVWVRDFGGGVIVGGTRIVGRRRLDPGDQLQIGRLHFELVSQEAPVKGTDLAPDEGEILNILSEQVERPAGLSLESNDLDNEQLESPKVLPEPDAVAAESDEPAQTADHLAGDILHNLYHPPKVKLVKFRPAAPTHEIASSILSPGDDVAEPLPGPEIAFDVPQGVSVAGPKRRVIALPRWVFTADGQLNPNVMFVLGIWVGIGISSAVVTFLRILAR